MVAQVVFVVFLQFFEACLCYVDEFYACLGRGGAGLVAFGYVLFARPCCLLHLVDGAVAHGWEVMLGEIAGYVVYAFCLLEGYEALIVSFWWQEVVGGGHDVN